MNTSAFRQYIESTLDKTNNKLTSAGLEPIRLSAISDASLLHCVLLELTDRQREAVLLRFETEEPKPYSEIAKEMGVTRERTVQLVHAGYETVLKKRRLDHSVTDPFTETKI